jgi:hydroxymethylpyrimidine/phosphomethylpyrimidine kinase
MKVMVSTSGSQLLPEKAVSMLCTELLPVTTICTPNIPEANLMLRESGKESIDIRSVEDLKALSAALHSLGPKYVLLKGGHLPLNSDYTVAEKDDEKKIVTNILFDGESAEVIEFPYQRSQHTHGTGCSLACE